MTGAKLACFRQHERGRAAKSSGPGPGAVVCTRCDSRIARIAKGPPTAAPAPKATRGQCDRCHKDFKLSSLKSRVLDAGKDLVYSCSTCYSKAVKKRALAAANASKKGRSELGSCCCRPLSTPTLKAQALFLLSLLEDSTPCVGGPWQLRLLSPSLWAMYTCVFARVCVRMWCDMQGQVDQEVRFARREPATSGSRSTTMISAPMTLVTECTQVGTVCRRSPSTVTTSSKRSAERGAATQATSESRA